MAQVGIKLKIDIEEMRERLNATYRRALSFREPFEAFGVHLVSAARRRFETETDPEGRPWPALKPSTLKERSRGLSRKRRAGFAVAAAMGGDISPKIRFITGMGERSITSRATALSLEFGSNRKFSGGKFSALAIHEEGGTPDMAPGPRAIPARPSMGVNAYDELELSRLLEIWLEGGV